MYQLFGAQAYRAATKLSATAALVCIFDGARNATNDDASRVTLSFFNAIACSALAVLFMYLERSASLHEYKMQGRNDFHHNMAPGNTK